MMVPGETHRGRGPRPRAPRRRAASPPAAGAGRRAGAEPPAGRPRTPLTPARDVRRRPSGAATSPRADEAAAADGPVQRRPLRRVLGVDGDVLVRQVAGQHRSAPLPSPRSITKRSTGSCISRAARAIRAGDTPRPPATTALPLRLIETFSGSTRDAGVPDRRRDPAPVQVAPEPGGLHELRVRHRVRHAVRVGGAARPGDRDLDELRRPLAVAHDQLGEPAADLARAPRRSARGRDPRPGRARPRPRRPSAARCRSCSGRRRC